MDLTELLRMSKRYGENPEYVLAGGGNTSVKDERTLYVKCSGTCLAQLTEQGIVAMDRNVLNHLMEKEYPAGDQEREAAFLADVMAARCDIDKTKRPSVEALLHHLFPQKYVLHVHPAMINGLTCSEKGQAAAEELFGEEVLWIPICRPGYVLGKLCREAMGIYRDRNKKDAQIVLLQNHGIFLAGDTVSEIDDLFAAVWKKIRSVISREPDLSKAEKESKALETAELLEKKTGKRVFWVNAKEAETFTRDRETANVLMLPFTPDHIVYCGAYPLYLRNAEDIQTELQTFTERTGLEPKVILAEDIGAFVVGTGDQECEKARLLLLDAMKVAVYAESFGGPLPMTEDLTDFIIHWEAESYRKKQSV